MPISMTARLKKVKQVSVELDGGTFDVWYHASVLTPRFMREMDGIESNAEKTAAMVRRVVDKWDVWETLDENGNGVGERLSVDESVDAADFTFLNAVITAVMEDMKVTPTTDAVTGSFS